MYETHPKGFDTMTAWTIALKVVASSIGLVRLRKAVLVVVPSWKSAISFTSFRCFFSFLCLGGPFDTYLWASWGYRRTRGVGIRAWVVVGSGIRGDWRAKRGNGAENGNLPISFWHDPTDLQGQLGPEGTVPRGEVYSFLG